MNVSSSFLNSTKRRSIRIPLGIDRKRVENSIQPSVIEHIFDVCAAHRLRTHALLHARCLACIYIYIFRYPWDITRSDDCTDRRRKNFTCRSRHVILTLSLNHPIWSSIRNSFLPFFPSILPLCRHPPSGWIPEMRANERVMDSARGACDRR